MRSRSEVQIERNRMAQLFDSIQKTGKQFDTAYSLGALHVLEWLLADQGQPISELILFKFKQQKV